MAWTAENAPRGVPFEKGDPRICPTGRTVTASGVKRRIRKEVLPALNGAIPSLLVGIRAGEPQALIAGLQLAIFALDDD